MSFRISYRFSARLLRSTLVAKDPLYQFFSLLLLDILQLGEKARTKLVAFAPTCGGMRSSPSLAAGLFRRTASPRRVLLHFGDDVEATHITNAGYIDSAKLLRVPGMSSAVHFTLLTNTRKSALFGSVRYRWRGPKEDCRYPHRQKRLTLNWG